MPSVGSLFFLKLTSPHLVVKLAILTKIPIKAIESLEQATWKLIKQQQQQQQQKRAFTKSPQLPQKQNGRLLSLCLILLARKLRQKPKKQKHVTASLSQVVSSLFHSLPSVEDIFEICLKSLRVDHTGLIDTYIPTRMKQKNDIKVSLQVH